MSVDEKTSTSKCQVKFLNNDTLIRAIERNRDAEELKLVLYVVKQLQKDAIRDDNSPFVLCFKPHFREFWVYLICALFVIIALVGSAGNVYMIVIMKREASYRRLINYLLTNLCLSDIVKCLLVLPMSLMQVLVQRWWLGSLLCNIMPMLQTGTCILSVLTYLLIGIDRYLVAHKITRRENMCGLYLLILAGLWVFCICLVLPFRSSVRYMSLSRYLGDSVAGGLCVIHQRHLMREYNIASFIALYVLPCVLVAYFFIRAREELRNRVERNESSLEQLRDSRDELNNHKEACKTLMNDVEGENNYQQRSRSMSFINYIEQEKAQLSLMLKANRCLSGMAALFVFCWFPLQIMLLVGHLIDEDSSTIVKADICFLVFMMLGLASTIINPILLMLQRNVRQSLSLSFVRTGLRRISSASRPRRSLRRLSSASRPRRKQSSRAVRHLDSIDCDQEPNA